MDFTEEELAELRSAFEEAFAEDYPLMTQMGGPELVNGWYKNPLTESFFAGFMMYAKHLRNELVRAAKCD